MNQISIPPAPARAAYDRHRLAPDPRIERGAAARRVCSAAGTVWCWR